MTIQALSKLYTANLDNEVVMFATNLKDFVESLKTLEPNAKVRNYAYYRREFMKTSMISLIVSDTKVYNLQEVFNRE